MKKARKEVSYVDAHNKAVKLYQKATLFFMWAGILCVFAAVIGVIQSAAGASNGNITDFTWPSSGFALSLSINIYLSYLFLSSLDMVMANFLIILISLVLGAGFALIGVFSARGKLWLLITGLALYLLDFALSFFVYFASPLSSYFVWTNYAFTLALHVVILAAGIVALIEYYRVLDIEKRFTKPHTLEKEEETEVIASGE